MTKVILVFISLITYSVFAGNEKENKVNDSAIESLLEGINSDNFGLKTSSAYMLGELKCEKAVIPLMRMLKSEDKESARIVAALALLKIGNEKGIFAIKQATRFDASNRVRKLCSNFYNAYLQKSSAVDLLAIR